MTNNLADSEIKVGDIVGNTIQGFDWEVLEIDGNYFVVKNKNTKEIIKTFSENMYHPRNKMAKGGKIEKALYNIDKWMPEDFELQREYYQLINDKDQKGMEEFLDMYADQDRLMRYGIQYEDLGKLSEAIISGSNYAKGGKTSDLYYIELNANDPKDKDLNDVLKKYNVKMKIISFDKNNSSPFESGEIKLIGEKNDIINVLKNPLTWDASEDDLNEFYLKDIKKMEYGGYMAKGGEMSDKKTILKIQNMMDDERMTLKLQKQFEGKDLFDDQIVDKYDVKQFDYREDSGNIEKFIRIKKNKFYVVPFDNQDDSYYYILVPKIKMADGGMVKGDIVEYEGKNYKIGGFDDEVNLVYLNTLDGKPAEDNIGRYLKIHKSRVKVKENKADGGYMAKGGMIVAQKTFDINDNEVSEDIYEFLLDYISDDFELSEEDQYAIRSEDPERVIDIMNDGLTDYEVVSRYDDDLIRLKIQKKMKMEDGGYMAKGGRTKDSQMTPFQRANQIAEDHFGEFGLATLEHDDFSKVIVMSKANKLAKQYGKSSFMLLDESDMETILNDNPDLLKDNYEDGGYMAKGGKMKTNPAKFRDKVNAITKKLAGTKVPKKYKKDYGATYDKKEANTAAKRIAGAKLAEVRAKLAKKKK
jgi:hypothetical protein